MANIEDREEFERKLEQMRARKLKDEEDRLKKIAARLKTREGELDRARAKVRAAVSESDGD